ncbi:MAG: DUF922 domain-containing protein [Polyangiaceae bacterium]
MTGSSEEQLGDAIRIGGPVRGGRRYAAFTDWRVHYTFGAAVGAELVTVDVVIHMPRWLETRAAPASLRERWQRYLDALEEHEAGHKAIAVRAANTILTRLRQLGPGGERVALGRALAEEILEDARREELTYDLVTDHGGTDPRIGSGADGLGRAPPATTDEALS